MEKFSNANEKDKKYYFEMLETVKTVIYSSEFLDFLRKYQKNNRQLTAEEILILYKKFLTEK